MTMYTYKPDWDEAPSWARAIIQYENRFAFSKQTKSVAWFTDDRGEKFDVARWRVIEVRPVDELLGECYDAVKSPSHYQIIEGVESIQVIASSLTEEGFKGFCLGNIIKYRMRVGKKDDINQELAKADFYKELFEQHKHLCQGSK